MADAVNEPRESHACLNITSMEVILSACGGQLRWKQIGQVFRCNASCLNDAPGHKMVIV